MNDQSEFVYDFDSEFQSDEEIEAALDEMVMVLAEDIIRDESTPSIVNPYRMEHLLYVYKYMKYITKGTSVVVTKKVHEPFASMGSVSVTGKVIEFGKMSWFMRAVQVASNFEVYPKTNGDVCMTFTFHGLTKPLV